MTSNIGTTSYQLSSDTIEVGGNQTLGSKKRLQEDNDNEAIPPYIKSFKPRKFSNATDRHLPVTSIVDSEKHAPSVGGEPILSTQINSNLRNYELQTISPI
mmetsp:Transcript_22205/g.34373  ORF Transcript_22205/g.34373 Transcript_22205/m.34373 type:complete len:101 (+) Transcript_22205:841-1143(+)